MTKGKKALTGIAITLLVLLVLAAIIFGIIAYCFGQWFVPESREICYEDLKTVMADDVVYLADEFMEENNLILKTCDEAQHYDPNLFPLHTVTLYMNRRNVQGVNDYTKRIENIDEYSYSMISKANMPITVSVRGVAGKNDNIKTKCDKKTDDGYKYGMSYGGELINTTSSIYKEAVVRTNASKSLVNKKNCILTVSVSIATTDAQNYTEEEIIAKFDKILNSALTHIERYGE